MRFIELRGKYAVEPHRYACVDDDMFDELNQYKWKAKPNGGKTNVYAVRVQKCDDGKSRDVRMHRVVLNYAGALDIDHINHDSLDNRRENLRVVTRQQNQQNRKTVEATGICKHCSTPFVRQSKAGSNPLLCSPTCKPIVERDPIHKCCAKCGIEFSPQTNAGIYCSTRCKAQVKWLRMKERGSPTIERNRIRCREWHAIRKIREGTGQKKFSAGNSMHAA